MWRQLNQESWRLCTLDKTRTNAWQQIAPLPEKMELFATPCFFLEIIPHCIYPRAQELHNCRGKRYRERSHVSCPRDSVFLRTGACYDSCLESEKYRTSLFLVFSLHTRTYTKCIWQLELSVWETSETITECFYSGPYILHDGRSWSWYHIIMARVQLEYHSVWSSCTLGREINIKTSRSFFAA